MSLSKVDKLKRSWSNMDGGEALFYLYPSILVSRSVLTSFQFRKPHAMFHGLFLTDDVPLSDISDQDVIFNACFINTKLVSLYC